MSFFDEVVAMLAAKKRESTPAKVAIFAKVPGEPAKLSQESQLSHGRTLENAAAEELRDRAGERAAILEYDAGISRTEAEEAALGELAGATRRSPLRRPGSRR